MIHSTASLLTASVDASPSQGVPMFAALLKGSSIKPKSHNPP
eukprot:CAMPEP_0114142294 /NCGR_PEP_ID=MMETSP0043_2-20121206/18372_1 /TAXON_ID=464988 /ORGANISM="Hemiselmis andersenii, Strain CCMP644" /LENGTH=41 /DNA_ID= /DNA_START= /DNA_END= /DNA_ORIENTATION=